MDKPRPLGDCELCGAPLAEGEEIVSCPQCPARYHNDCWEFIQGKCVRLGCSGRNAAPSDAQTEVSPGAASRGALRISRADLTAPIERVNRQLGQAAVLAEGWDTPGSTLWFSLIWTSVLYNCFRLAAWGVRELLDPAVYATAFGLNELYTVASAPFWWWLAPGLVYGLLHRSYLRRSWRMGYQILRLLLCVLYVVPFCYLTGFLFFFYAFLWPDRLWGITSLPLWITPAFSWILAGAGGLWTIVLFATRYSVFEVALGLWLLLAVFALTTLSGTFVVGLSYGALAWCGGWIADLVWPGSDFAVRWAQVGAAIGGTAGFVSGLAQPFRKQGANA